MKGIKVFITGAGAPGTRGVMKCYRIGAREEGRDIQLVTCDMNPQAYGFHLADSSYVVPSGRDPSYVGKMLEICEKEKPDLVISGVDNELLPLAKARKDFERLGARVALSDAKAIEIAVDKAKTYGFFKGSAFIPENMIVNSPEQFRKAVESLGYPHKTVCFKPAYSYGMRGFRILKKDVNRSEMFFNEKPASVFMDLPEALGIFEEQQEKGHLPTMLVMEYLEGKEYTVDLLLRGGEPLLTVPRERVATRQGISTIAHVEKNQQIIGIAEKIVKALCLNYNVNLQLKYSSDGMPKLIEIQSRLAGTTIACAGAGANLPYLALKIALGEKFEIPHVRWGTVAKRFWEEVYTDGKDSWFYGIKEEY